MGTLGALLIILLVAGLIVWLFVVRPRGGDTAAPMNSPPRPGPLTTEQAVEIVRPTIKVAVPTAPSRQLRDENYPTQVVGESYNQAALRSIAEAHPDRGQLDDSAECEVRAMLIPETDNPHDANAVRVEIDGKKVGYLSRADAARYRAMLGLGQTPVGALTVGGWDRESDDRGPYGVRLAFSLDGPSKAEKPREDESVGLGIALTTGSYGYGIAGVDDEACATLTSVGGSAETKVDLVPVPEEQTANVKVGEHLFLGSIGGIDAQVILRHGGITGVPARVSIRRRRTEDARGGTYATVKLALRIDPATIPREAVVDGCARTPGAYGQHVQGVHKYTATLKRLCSDGMTGQARAVLRSTEGGFLVTIGGADVGTVLGTTPAYVASIAIGDIEVDAMIAKRLDGRRGYNVHLAIELTRPATA